MKIALTISSMSGGGAERVMSILANCWVEAGISVVLISLESSDKDFYELDSRIERLGLGVSDESHGVWKAVRNNLFRLKALRNAIQDAHPDIIISFIDRTNVLTLLASRGLSLPIIVSEHIDPRQLPPGGVWNYLRVATYQWADLVVVLTEELRGVVSKFVAQRKVTVIPNPALPVPEKLSASCEIHLPEKFIVAMGRLNRQKGFDMLLRAFAGFNIDGWSLVILGEGPDREVLEKEARDLGISNKVFLPGAVKNPHEVIRRAEMFVMSSRFEGFPMALVEAMSCGAAVVSFDCPTGPGEIIENGSNGILVPNNDVAALRNAIVKLASDKQLRQSLARNAEKIIERFSVEKVMKLWDDAIESVCHVAS